MLFPIALSLATAVPLELPPVQEQTRDTSFRARVAAWRAAREPAIVAELAELLAIPNLASDSVNIRRNAALIVRMLEKRGATARLLEVPGSPPAVYGELPVPGATRTVVFYSHYDGQPVDLSRWASPPWQVTLRDGPILGSRLSRVLPMPQAGQRFDPEWRIFARSASDDKGPIVAMLAAIDALRAAGIPLSANLKLFLDGEEEAGSPNLARMLAAHRELLGSDLWIFGDGPIDPRGLPRAVLGVRGITTFRLTVYGPASSLHSGHYGNVAPNPGASGRGFLAMAGT